MRWVIVLLGNAFLVNVMIHAGDGSSFTAWYIYNLPLDSILKASHYII